eukprot:8749413-Alexandrium_andersonii.AAC.1
MPLGLNLIAQHSNLRLKPTHSDQKILHEPHNGRVQTGWCPSTFSRQFLLTATRRTTPPAPDREGPPVYPPK